MVGEAVAAAEDAEEGGVSAFIESSTFIRTSTDVTKSGFTSSNSAPLGRSRF